MSSDFMHLRTMDKIIFGNIDEGTAKFREAIAVKAFKTRLEMARLNVSKKSATSEAQKPDSSGYFIGEFDLSGLPLPVKKHIITAGIIQGDIFQYGDGFASIKEITSQEKTAGKILHLDIRALTPKSYEKAIETVGTLLDEILDPKKKTFKREPQSRSWDTVLKNEFEIQNLIKPVISHLITQGIIKGEVYLFSGAVVHARGSPYMVEDLPQEYYPGRPIYLLIQAPNEKALYWAVERIQHLIKEAEENLPHDIPQFPDKSIQLRDEPPSHEPEKKRLQPPSRKPPEEVITPEVIVIDDDEPPQPTVKHYPAFMPQLGQNYDADIKRCVLLVQWLLAHPLLVSFIACPPKGLESKKLSKKMALTALLCLPLYDQYTCSHLSKKTCSGCYNFFLNAQNAVHQWGEAVFSSGYDISKLIPVDNYIKDLPDQLAQVGVVYDYPLPVNLYYLDHCRLFIDLVVNCGVGIEESHIRSYLRSTDQWYPNQAFEKSVISTEINSCSPSKNRKTHQYPTYCTIDHHGGLINFQLSTIGMATPDQLFPPDAPKIPRCKYFPFLKRLSVFSKLHDFIKKVKISENKLTDEISTPTISISQAAYQSTLQTPVLAPLPPTAMYQPNLNNPFGNNQNLLGYTQSVSGIPLDRSLENSSQAFTTQNTFPNSEPTHETRNAFTCAVPPSFSTMQESKENKQKTPNPNPSPSRVERKRIRKEKSEKKREEKTEKKVKEIEKALEILKEKHGTNSFWTVDHKLEPEKTQEKLSNLLASQANSYNLQFGSTQPSMQFPQNLQQALSSMQMSMPVMQPTLFGIQTPMKPALLNAEQIFEGQHPKQDSSQQQNPLSEAISKLQEFIQATSAETAETESVDSSDGEEAQAIPQQAIPQQAISSDDSPQNSSFSCIIQQLQQYIDSNNPTSSQESLETKTPIEKQLKKPVASDAREKITDAREKITDAREKITGAREKITKLWQASRVNVSHNQKGEFVQTQLKRVYDEPTPIVIQPKRVCNEGTITKPTAAAVSSEQKSDSTFRRVFYQEDAITPVSTQPKRKYNEIIITNPTTTAAFSTEQKSESTYKIPVSQKEELYQRPSLSMKKNVMKKLNTFSSKKPETAVKKPAYQKKAAVDQKPSSSMQKHLVEYSQVSSSISFLGDSLLKRARTWFGGTNKKDIREDKFTIEKLTENVVKFHEKEARLNPYCVVMCGANDIINSITNKDFCLQLKKLVNYLLQKGYFVLLATLPLTISSKTINKGIPEINGLLLSYHTKPDLSIIRFHQVFKEQINSDSLLESIHIAGKTDAVLSDFGCAVLQELIEEILCV